MHTVRSKFLLATLVFVSLTASGALCAQPPTLESEIQPLIAEHKGRVAVAIKDLTTSESFALQGDEPMPTASLIKVAVMVEAYRQADAGKVNLSEMITLRDEDKVQGSGILTTHFSSGMQLSLRDAIRLMIAYSDNTATNLVLDRIGLGATASAMEQFGLPNTKIHAKVFRGDTSIFPERSKQFGLGSTTANEMLQLLERLNAGQLASESATKEMLDHLRACQAKNSFPKLLPPGTKIAHKTGSVSAVRTDAGIIDAPRGPLIVVVLTCENEDQRWTDENAGERLCARIAKSAYDHFNPADSVAAGDLTAELKQGANGWLQRTLNVRMNPAPGLSVDGDFGPGTHAAVVAFQQAHRLEATGLVDAPTWRALGPLVTSDPVITDPAQFDLKLPEKQPADAPDGTPFVTCKAWGLCDARTGEFLGGNRDAEPLDFASTTKLMTAWLVLRLAESDPAVLQEVASVSPRAADTPGSTANLKAGEKVVVQDLLHGLLLPSGNDASVVIAEHFGGRFATVGRTGSPSDHAVKHSIDPSASNGGPTANPSIPSIDRDPDSRHAANGRTTLPSCDDGNDPLPRFVAEMNRTAADLGMNDTCYRNPHGLTVDGHRSTVRDLLKLAAKLVRDGRILPYVQTRKHIGRLEGASGYVRYELWTNTNKLLDTQGYLGMKTGTTDAAGACLVSLAERGDDRLLVVVLGATSSDARYVDTRNLFRWAWASRRRE
jgi:D-alanyl-D-alanine carboxypeptidase